MVHDGSLEFSDSRLTVDGSPYDWFTVDLDKGNRIVATVTGKGFEPTLFLFNPERTQVVEQQGSQGTAIVNYKASASGTYSIMVNAQKPGATGAYKLNLRFEDR